MLVIVVIPVSTDRVCVAFLHIDGILTVRRRIVNGYRILRIIIIEINGSDAASRSVEEHAGRADIALHGIRRVIIAWSCITKTSYFKHRRFLGSIETIGGACNGLPGGGALRPHRRVAAVFMNVGGFGHDGVVSVQLPAGDIVAIPVDIRTRCGKHRVLTIGNFDGGDGTVISVQIKGDGMFGR